MNRALSCNNRFGCSLADSLAMIYIISSIILAFFLNKKYHFHIEIIREEIMKTKQTVLLLTGILVCTSLFANTVSFQNAGCSGIVSYNESAGPGEAVFARMSVRGIKNQKRKSQAEVQGVLQLIKDGKKIDSARFYQINQKARKTANIELLASIPLSLWTDTNADYSLKVIFSTPTESEKEFSLPFEVEARHFEREVLDLNEANSNIKQNMSAERMAQIEKLNTILGTAQPNNVYTLKPFIKPVKPERMTAHFGDKRIYKYTDGTSENSQHYGHDYGVPEGTDVFACAEGRVVLAEERISTGWSIVIEHLPGLYSLYYHLSRLDVKENDYVKQGEKIGLSGSTGLATGPHLHWEVRLNMAAVTPDFFTKDFTFEE